MCVYIYIYIYIYMYIYIYIYIHNIMPDLTETDHNPPAAREASARPTRHILPPSEIDLGLFWAVFTGSGGKHLFHRLG